MNNLTCCLAAAAVSIFSKSEHESNKYLQIRLRSSAADSRTIPEHDVHASSDRMHHLPINCICRSKTIHLNYEVPSKSVRNHNQGHSYMRHCRTPRTVIWTNGILVRLTLQVLMYVSNTDKNTLTFIRIKIQQMYKYKLQTRTVLTRRVSSYGLPAWVSSELGPMGGTTFTTSAAALEPGHY